MRIISVGLFLYFFLIHLSVDASPFCAKANKVDEDLPAGFVGQYEIVGRLPKTGKIYAGKVHIEVDVVKQRYVLTRIVNGKKTVGEGCFFHWTDNVHSFEAQYRMNKQLFKLSCSNIRDGDNYYRLSCLSGYDGQPTKSPGLEALFQVKW